MNLAQVLGQWITLDGPGTPNVFAHTFVQSSVLREVSLHCRTVHGRDECEKLLNRRRMAKEHTRLPWCTKIVFYNASRESSPISTAFKTSTAFINIMGSRVRKLNVCPLSSLMQQFTDQPDITDVTGLHSSLQQSPSASANGNPYRQGHSAAILQLQENANLRRDADVTFW